MASTPPITEKKQPAAKELSQRSHLRSLCGVQILSTGCYLPELLVTNEDLSELGYDAEWILQRTGIRSRCKCSPEQATSDMAVEASRMCIERAGAHPDDIDLVVVATMTPDMPMPSSACLVQDRLGLRAAAMDINAACAGFMYALITAMQYVKCGTSELALVIGADTNTRIVYPGDRKTFPLFGDGAGAVLVGAGGDQQGLLAFTLGSEGDGADLLRIAAGGSRCPVTTDNAATSEPFMDMDGRSVFKWAVRVLADSIRDVLLHAELDVSDISLVVLHQANSRIIDAASESLGLDRDRLVVNVDRYGNTSAGSIPICLHEAHQAGRIRQGDLILMCGFGAGLAWGTSLMQW